MLFVFLILLASSASYSENNKDRRLCPTEPGVPRPRCGLHTHYESCPRQCPPQKCSSLWSKLRCEEPNCCQPGCRCDDGYLRHDATGECITVNECMHPCGPNEYYVNQEPICQRTCSNWPHVGPDSRCKPFTGCICKPAYARLNPDATGPCVPIAKCLHPCGPNEYYVNQEPICQRTCSNWPHVGPDSRCKPFTGCICKPAYARLNPDATGPCVPIAKCPPPSIKCGYNEVPTNCKQVCPPQSCDIAYTSYLCASPAPCKPGCNCRDNHLRNSSGICIPNDLCPPPCPVTDECKRTCAVPNPKNCPAVTLPENNQDGCQCQSGYVLSDINGKCIKIGDCPKNLGCNGDPNAVIKTCPTECPRTCKLPDIRPCTKRCLEVGCECAHGFILSDQGKCIPPEKCPGGDPCGVNATFVACTYGCPANYCPVDDNRAQVVCEFSPFAPCTPGCSCKLNHKRKSVKDKRCILSSECPPVKCTRPHEVWDSCPSDCLAERCEDVDREPSTCNTLVLNCQPKCVCEKGYFRNQSDICVPAEECRQCKANETYVFCNAGCPTNYCPTNDNRAFIACDPPYPCPSGCACKLNYKRKSFEDDTCISVKDCPPVNCTRPNEIYDPCPSACLAESCSDVDKQPTTCNTFVANSCQPQCICKKGYFRNKDDICVPAEECRQCPANQTIVDCNFRCPHQYCPQDDDLAILLCKPPRDCPSGCGCLPNYKIKSYDDDTCVLASDCPAVTCTRPHEEWDPCSSDCLNEKCVDIDMPSTGCDSGDTCTPRCVCEKGYYRNESGICISTQECRASQCSANETYVWCNAGCPTNYCPVNDNRAIIACSPPYPCPSGCACKVNYRRKSLKDPTCILATECPAVTCTRPNEEWDPCPSACLAEKCDDVDKQPTTCNTLLLNCQPQCVCKKGYFRNKDDICVPASECRECPANQTIVDCTFRCPHHYCPKDDDKRILLCKPPRDCPSGCGCLPNYKIRSRNDNTCVLASDCPAVKCTRPHEVWDPCSSDCLNEECKDIDMPSTGCDSGDTCTPRCVCEKGYYRNESGICISTQECRASQCSANETYVRCNAGCPTNYCPTNDNRGIIACSPPNPCPSGCACRVNYKRKSLQDKTCILVSECPPVKCTRQNEVWNPCPSACPFENCDQVGKPPVTCNTLVLNCQPRCVCADGFFRNQTGICVSPKQCPSS